MCKEGGEFVQVEPPLASSLEGRRAVPSVDFLVAQGN